ncbi:hypothetical protein BJ170DRAFT_712553 [Xylariales sp. AK1849]|nr:hypothetical protein BJ170DRAFT_712553 [Xylariales sp. AK1849]
MFTTRQFIRRNVLTPLISQRALSQTCLQGLRLRLENTDLEATTPVARQLKQSGLWVARTRRKSPKELEDEEVEADNPPQSAKKPKARKSNQRKKATGDKSRVNIVSESLCDDVFSYVGSSLERHKGCDIIDIYPGAGLWSRKLNEFLKPRSHILLEPDVDLYKPLLQPLLDKPGTTIVPKSGIIWTDLSSVLTPEYLPHQKAIERGSKEEDQRNDTLLVTANLAFHPRKKFSGFESVAVLVLHQFIDSIRASSLFQKYGQVRLLVWTRREDKATVLPRCLQHHKRSAIQGELYCEWIREVVETPGNELAWYIRDSVMDRASALATLKRMQTAKIAMPQGRESEAYKAAKQNLKKGRNIIPGTVCPEYDRPYHQTLESLKGAQQGTDKFKEMKRNEWRLNSDARKYQHIFQIQTALDALTELRRSGAASSSEIAARDAEVAILIDTLNPGVMSEFMMYKDNLHLYRQEPPLLHWDRRAVEPLVSNATEFFPNVECSLLDIQPRPVHPLLRQIGPNTHRIGDAFELIARALLSTPSRPIDKALDAVWPGAADYIVPRCASFRDLDRGGVNSKDRHAQLSPRMLNVDQWEELVKYWHEWPFRPEFRELVSRSQDESDFEDDGTIENFCYGISESTHDAIYICNYIFRLLSK